MFQPCSWNELDINFNYVVDTYGRTGEGDIARVRLTGFKPYFYLRVGKESVTELQSTLKSKTGYPIQVEITKEQKLDAISGFSELKKIDVWKIEFYSLWAFKYIAREFKNNFKIGSRKLIDSDIFESNLPPYLRLFHEQGLNPASAFSFDGKEEQDDIKVDKCFITSYKTLKPITQEIPLYALSYDLEVYSESGQFPLSKNLSDEIIQIGLSTRWTDDFLNPVERIVLISGTCIPSKSIKYISCKNEKELLLKFQEIINYENPDILVGYNTFGFDDGYIAERCSILGINLSLGRCDSWKNQDNVPTIKKTFELASGKYEVRYLDLGGRLTIDLLLSIRREQNLDSYKLDNVASTFLRDKVTDFVILSAAKTRMFEIHTKSTRGLFEGNYVRFDIVTNTLNPYADGKKFKVKSVFPKKFIVELDQDNYLNTFDDITIEERKKLEWSFTKDDISASQMFKMHKGTPEERSEIAKYCIQDCDLVLTLMAKLDTLVNARGMADVCRVPVDYIFLRGQGIKIYSAVVYYASQRNQILQTQESFEGDMSYEGAIVLPPKIGMYLDQPIPVLDFNSLYPTNMIAFNLSPDTLVYTKTYDSDGHIISKTGIDTEFPIDEISYDIPGGRKTCGFVQASKPELIGMLPLTLDILLKKRKETRKQMENETDDSKKSVLNGLQLAYKTVANSVYGQCGSRSSAIRKVEVAACTTAAGREKILFAKGIIESEFGGDVIAGDTDSLFIKFVTKDLAESIDLAKKAADRITSLCRKPYKIEYEKTFFPFILFCRKRYIGLMYEDDVKKCKRKFMGIALKRRDSAPVVKDIYGGALDIVLEQRNIRLAEEFVKRELVRVLKNEVPLEKFIITKQLRDDYKNPDQIAHRVLADRMTERDPGNKPQVGDRIAYVYVAEHAAKGKQGERIENLDYFKQKGLHIDTIFYVKNQIQNPVAQLFALGIEQITGYIPKKYPEFPDLDEEDSILKVLALKEKELDKLLFLGSPELSQIIKRQGNSMIRGPMDAFIRR